MKFSCTKENIKQGLNNVAHVAGKNINLPILSNVLIKCLDNSIQFSATDLEIGVQANIRGKVEKKGEFTVQAKLLTDYVNLLPNEKIDFELIENELVVICKNYKTKIKGENADDYPVIPKIEEKEFYNVDFEEFRRGIMETMFSAANNEARIELSGVYFEFNQKELTLAATDSYRLSECKLKYKNSNTDVNIKKIIIPTKTLQEVARFNFNGKDEILTEKNTNTVINIYLSDNQVLFNYDDIKLTSRVIEGQYPDYRQIIPTLEQKQTGISVNRQDLIRAIKASSLFSRNTANDVRLDFSGSEHKVTVSSNAQSGESTVDVSSDINGKDGYIVLNYKYLLDGLNALNCEQVTLEIMGVNTPCLLKAEGRSDYLYIIMPIKQ